MLGAVLELRRDRRAAAGGVAGDARRASRSASFSRFGARVAALKNVAAPDGVEVDAGIAERFDLAVVAEGGVFADARRRASSSPAGAAPALRHDYGQTAWVGIATFAARDRRRRPAASPTSASPATARPRCCR